MSDLCVECNGIVRSRQHVVTCEVCDRWQHRKCNTGITQKQYFAAMKLQTSLNFTCKGCTDIIPPNNPQLHSTILNASSSSADVQHGTFQLNFSIGTDEPSSLRISPETDDYNDFQVQSTANTTRYSTDVPPGTFNLNYSTGTVESSSSSSHTASPQCPDTTVHPLNVTFTVESNTLNDVMGTSEHSSNMTDNLSMDFDITRGPHADVTVIHERSLDEAPITDSIVEDDDQVTYEVVESGTNRGYKKLVSSDGFSFCVKSKKDSDRTVFWRCSVRNKTVTCKATVSQRGQIFVAGKLKHCHPADASLPKKVKFRKEMKQRGRENLFTSASKLVEDNLPNTFDNQDFNLPKTATLVRGVNRTRAKTRPKDPGPAELDFEVLHLFFFHYFCLKKLQERRTEDYRTVLQRVLEILPGTPDVQGFVMDFEPGYHRRINGKAGRGNVQFYVLVPLLFAESNLVAIQAQQVHEHVLSRYHRPEYRRLHEQLEVLWNDYDNRKLKTCNFLKDVARVYRIV